MNTLPIYPRLHALAHLDDDSFQIACSADEELQMICDGRYKPGHQKFFNQLTDYLYMIRSQALFDDSLLKYQEGLTWKEFCDRLTYLYKSLGKIGYYPLITNQLNLLRSIGYDDNNLIEYNNQRLSYEYAKEGKLMELKILYIIGVIPDALNTVYAIEYNHLNILIWLDSLVLPNDFIFDNTDNILTRRAAQYGRLHILQWLASLKPPNGPILPLGSPEVIDAVNFNHLDVLQWLIANVPFPNITNNDLVQAANIAKIRNYINILNWLASQDPPILPPN